MSMAPTRVLIVDDSIVVRRMVANALADDPDIDVVGTASNGRVALERVAALEPDLVTLDIEMPILDGIATLAELRRSRPRLPVVVFSTMTESGARATLDALAAGANDFVTKPSEVGGPDAAVRAVQAELIPRIHALTARSRRTIGRLPDGPGTAPSARSAAPTMPRLVPVGSQRVAAVVLGVSTGGPNALAQIWPSLAHLTVPVLVVQHMPPVFTAILAKRLNDLGSLPVAEARDGETVTAGRAWLAPGGFHMTLDRTDSEVHIRLDEGPPVWGCRPAVDLLFSSAARTFGGGTLAAVLTGMGNDGADGADEIRRAGGTVIAQDEATSVVWGMPGAVVGAGLADEIVPLDHIATTINRFAGTAGAARPLAVQP